MEQGQEMTTGPSIVICAHGLNERNISTTLSRNGLGGKWYIIDSFNQYYRIKKRKFLIVSFALMSFVYNRFDANENRNLTLIKGTHYMCIERVKEQYIFF